ncbi:MAG: type IVB secretion system protein IcmH/DotU [Pseudomonadota bacterium]
MSDNDPFADREGTVIKPSPRGATRMSRARVPSAAPDVTLPGEIASSGANPVLAAATSLLTIASQLRRTPQYDDTVGLFTKLSAAIKQFEADLASQRYPPQSISIARYVLCGFLDEAILNTPWGSQSGWSARSLLAEFHNEVYAGEKIFELLERMSTDPAQQIDLIELIYVCISLGFQGRYRQTAEGMQRLEQIRLDTYALIARYRGPRERDLSPHWQGVSDQRPGLVKYVPWWVVGSVALGLLIVGFILLLRTLNVASDPVVSTIAALGRDLPAVSDGRSEPVVFRRSTLSELLIDDIDRGLIDAGTDPQSVILRGLFPSASATVGDEHASLLRRIADALAAEPGTVVISGHTDNVPIRTLRFPSNWDLSRERAEAVMLALQSFGVDAVRMTAEPRADSDPLCDTCDQNDPQTRESNRRVEILLKAGVSRL